MKTSLRVFLSICLLFFLLASAADAKRTTKGQPFGGQLKHIETPRFSKRPLENGVERLSAVSAYSTTFLAYYTFDDGAYCVDEGWTSHDLTAQKGDYWHVTDFATGGEACGPGTFGRLVVLEGSQSLWCGACPDATGDPLCRYATLPGYGNDWDQAFCTKACLSVDSNVVVDYLAGWDAEPGYDATTVEVDNCDDEWVAVAGGVGVYDGVGSGFQSIAVPNAEHSGALRVRFHFESDGGWSDQDGLYDSDGAFILDSLSVSDASGVVLAVEDLESEMVGDNDADEWETCTPPGYGDYAQLGKGITMLQQDPCWINLSCIWNFYKGSTYNYACNTPVPAPGQLVVPYGNDDGQYIWNEIWSPDIPWTGSGTGAHLAFDVYRDLKLNALVFYIWRVKPKTAGCPPNWADREFLYGGENKDWLRHTEGIGDLVGPGVTDVQISLGVIDACAYWCGVYGNGTCHSHAPLFDNVEVYRVGNDGPVFAWRDIDEFQDNFASDGTTTGTVRIDMAQDILPNDNPGILPGDSAVIQVADPAVGLAGDANTGWGPAVYTYVAVFPKYKYTGSQIQAPEMRSGNLRWPWVGDVVLPADPRSRLWWAAGNSTWHVFRHDSCFTSGGATIADRYCIDLNDNLFVPGDTVYFFREAINTAAVSGYHAGGKDGVWYPTGFGATEDRNLAAQNADEATCLPAAGLLSNHDILYVDGMNFRDAQWMFDTSFREINMFDEIDRYDIRGPSSAVGNHPGARVVDPVAQLSNVYRFIIWNTGDLQTSFSDGSGTPDKSDDTGVLKAFADNLPNSGGPTLRSGGIYLSGDDVAEVWAGYTSASAVALNFYLTYNIYNTNHVAAGFGIYPFMVGTAGGAFDDYYQGKLVVFGGCPVINDFDVLVPTGAAVLEANYETGWATGGAIVSQTTTNPLGAQVGFMLSGFGFDNIATDQPTGIMDRFSHLEDILRWANFIIDCGIGIPPSRERQNNLAQNYPNPFNPTTTIAYTIKDPGHISLRVYNVAGQLVKTLVDEVQSPETVRPVRWDGRNDAGQQIASGVYFYKLVTKGFTKTRKMVLLK